MRVGVLGINHKLAELKFREQLALTCQRWLSPAVQMQDAHIQETHSFVLLSTCNRTEVYFSSEDLADTHSYLLTILRNAIKDDDFDQKPYSYFGQDCLQHLCKVTAGLDSAIVAETEIQGQVKDAYETTKEIRELPFELHYLFQKSLAIGKKARALLPFTPGMPGIEHAILQIILNFAAPPQKPKILFVGASTINEKIVKFLKARGQADIAITNRTGDKGDCFAKNYGVTFIDWSILQHWQNFDIIILATKAPYFLINESNYILQRKSAKLIIDLSIPRNADPATALKSGATLYNMDDINMTLSTRKYCVEHSLHSALELITKAVEQQMLSLKEKESNRLRICGTICA